MMLSSYPSISTSWRTIPKSNFFGLLPILYCGICISNLLWMAQHERVLCHLAHSWAHPCSELVKAAKNLWFFFPVLPETLTPEQTTKYKAILEIFDGYLKHISNTEPCVQVSLELMHILSQKKKKIAKGTHKATHLKNRNGKIYKTSKTIPLGLMTITTTEVPCLLCLIPCV